MIDEKKPPSYEKVHYLLRLKKQIERKIITETLQGLSRLCPMSDITNYHYFGLGSIYFADFILFHKYLNINNMTSIDDKKEDKNRFKFNKPYKFIEFYPLTSKEFMQRILNWNDKLMIWLDYDATLNEKMIEDFELVARRAKSDDIFFTTIECENKNEKRFLDNFKEYLPLGTPPEDVATARLPGVLRKIISGSLRNGMAKREVAFELDFLQLFHLTYRDTKKMYTYGCIFLEENQIDYFKDKVKELQFVSTGDQLVDIDCPLLTPLEKMRLDQCIVSPDLIDTEGKDIGYVLPTEKIESYKKFYKYYPQFFEAI